MTDKQGKEIISVLDPRFKPYGRVLKQPDLSEVEAYMATVDYPQSGNYYKASDEKLENMEAIKQIGLEVYGGMPFMAGPCLGNNKVQGGVEYHNSSEVTISMVDNILFLGKRQDMDCDEYDGSKLIGFFFPKGSVVETYATTLHYTPCAVKEHFKTVCMLPKGTGDAIERHGILKKKNKWFIAHETNVEKIKSGDFPGLKGERREVK